MELLSPCFGYDAGMLVVNTPVYLADRFAPKIPLKLVRIIAAMIFAIVGLTMLMRLDAI